MGRHISTSPIVRWEPGWSTNSYDLGPQQTQRTPDNYRNRNPRTCSQKKLYSVSDVCCRDVKRTVQSRLPPDVFSVEQYVAGGPALADVMNTTPKRRTIAHRV